MTSVIYLVAGLILLVVLSFIGIMSRYKRCKPNQVLVVYGKTSKNSRCKCISGGGVFVYPWVQNYAYMSMTPIAITCGLEDALDKNNIHVIVNSEITVAISTDPLLIQNAATRLLGMTNEEQIKLI